MASTAPQRVRESPGENRSAAIWSGADLYVLIGPAVAGNAVVFTIVGLQISRSRGAAV